MPIKRVARKVKSFVIKWGLNHGLLRELPLTTLLCEIIVDGLKFVTNMMN